MMKRNLLFLLTFIVSTMTVWATVGDEFTVGNLKYKVTSESPKTVELTGYDGDLPANLNIPATVNGYSVTTIGQWTFYYCSGLTSVTFAENSHLTTIGQNAFTSCAGLTSITIPTSVTTIGQNAFKSCAGLTSVTFAENSQLTTIGQEAFRDAGLTSITIPASVTTIDEGTFYNCYCLTSVTFAENSQLTTIGKDAFRGSGLTSITIPAKVATIDERAFATCSGLTSITISASVTNIGQNAFRACSGLTSVTIPTSVTTIGEGAFWACTGLTLVTFAENSQLTTIGQDAFRDTGMTSVTIPASVTTIGQNAFLACTGLTLVTFAENSQLTTVGDDVFYGCSALTNLTVPVTDMAAFCNNSFMNQIGQMGKPVKLVDGVGTEITSYVIPSTVTSISAGAFSGCTGLTLVTFAENSQLTTVGDDVFYGCSALTNLTVPVTDMAAFCNNSFMYQIGQMGKPVKLVDGVGTEVTSYVIPSTVTSIGNYAFYNCTDLTSVTIPASVTNIGQSAFADCTGLTSVIIPASVTNIGQSAFADCTGLTSVTFAENSQLTTVGDDVFTGCSALSNVTVPVTDLAAFCNNSFMYQIKQKIALPVKLVDGVGTEITSCVVPSGVTSIGHYAFYNCTGLTSVTIPSTVTSLGSYSFYNCTGLTSVTIPSTVTSLGNYAFYNCTGLASVTIPISVPTFGENTFKNCPLTTVKVPVTDVAAFCNNTLLERIAYYYTEKPIILIDGDGAEITSVTIPDGVTSISNSAFRNCTGLASVIAHDNVTSVNYLAFLNTAWYNNLPDGVTYIGKVAYKFKGSAASVTIKDGTTCICSYAFGGSTLTSVIIPEGVTTIESNAFQNCASLASVTLPDGLTTIGSSAFWNCPALTSIAIPASVTTIEADALRHCPSVTLYATTPPSASNAFMYNDGFRLYVFSDLVDTYKNKKSSYHLYHKTNVVAIPDLTANDAGGELGNWCTYYNGLADVTVPDGTTIYKAALNSTKNGVILTEVDGNIVKKGEAVLLKSADNIMLSSAASSGTGDYTGNELQGVDVSTPQASGITYYVLSKPAADKAFGFYKLTDGTNLAANKAFIAVASSSTAREFIGLDSETTAVFDLNNKEESIKNSWYTLDGRKLNGEPKQRGIYVKNGRKIIVK